MNNGGGVLLVLVVGLVGLYVLGTYCNNVGVVSSSCPYPFGAPASLLAWAVNNPQNWGWTTVNS
jgi:hypothetical protein